MEQIPRYEVVYTENAIQDIEEKANYITNQFHDPGLAERWYLNLRASIQEQLTIFPYKFQQYNVEPWDQRGIRQYITHNDVVLYNVDDEMRRVYIWVVCTKGRDLAAHLAEQE